ncbi:MAG: HNH endonuclease [Gammaproteobacteria bacterium AqS3]|nr:HNH endonuclease [Gammaproteobacteria bacterium AqS3]
MARSRNTDKNGARFTQSKVESVWRKGRIIDGYDPNIWRRDRCGDWIKRAEYGNTNSKHGWEIDHIVPVSKNGSDDLSNLQPLQWDNNRRKADQDQNSWNCR